MDERLQKNLTEIHECLVGITELLETNAVKTEYDRFEIHCLKKEIKEQQEQIDYLELRLDDLEDDDVDSELV